MPKKAKPKMLYFFLNGDLHKKLLINRGADQITAWNYPKGKRVTYDYSTTLLRCKKAYTTSEVLKIVNRTRMVIHHAMRRGDIARPQNTYGLDENRKFYKYMWSEEDILDLHAFLLTVHRGRPRKDGMIVPGDIPSLREVRALLNDETVTYIKQGDEFIPSWRAKEF